MPRGKFHDSIRKSIFYANLGADRRGFDRNARIESPKRSLRFQLGHGFGSGMRKNEEAANEAVSSGVIAPRRNNNAHLHRPSRATYSGGGTGSSIRGKSTFTGLIALIY